MNTQQKSIEQTMVTIGGMGCTGCTSTIQDALENIEGVAQATVDLESKTATVTYSPETVTADDFKQAVGESGYDFVDVR